MPPDANLGRGLERLASDVDIDVRQSFVDVARIAHRRQLVRRTMFVAAAMVVTAGAVAGGVIGVNSTNSPDRAAPVAPAPSPTAAPSGLGHEAYGRIAGSYVTTIPRSGGVVSTYDLAGQWKMTFNRNGSVTFAAPYDYVRHVGVPELSTYSLAGSTIMTTALSHEAFGCSSSGVYRWRLSHGTLTFATLKDDCPYRPAVFASRAWTRM